MSSGVYSGSLRTAAYSFYAAFHTISADFILTANEHTSGDPRGMTRSHSPLRNRGALKGEITMAVIKIVGVGERGKYFDDEAIGSVLNYAMQTYKTCPELIFTGHISNITTAAQEMEAVAIQFGKNSRKRLRHTVLSFSPQELGDIRLLAEIAQQIAAYAGYIYQTVAIVHLDREHPHIHIIMNTVSWLNGLKYRGTKEEYYQFKKYINDLLRPLGLFAYYQK